MQALIKSLPGWLKLLLVFPLLFLNGMLLFAVIGRFKALFDYLIIATLIAFLLKLTIQFLVDRGIRKGLAIAAVGILSFAGIVFLGLTFVPLMVTELGNLVDDVPRWLDASQDRFDQLTHSAIARELTNAGIDIDELFQKLYVALSKGLNGIGGKALGLVTGTLNGVLNTFVILILTIFLLLGGQSFWNGIFSWFPQPWDQKVPCYTAEIFKDYFLSRLILATGSSIARLIIFAALGLPYTVLFAFGLGLASLIPFAGAVVTLFGTIILGLKSGVFAVKFFLSAIVIDQITDNGIAPKLMGDKIGLNPVWILISIFIGAELGGLLGVLLAVPVASVIKRIVDELRFGDAATGEEIVVSELRNDELPETT
ncbi:MAG: AI-2E family transporter [Synechocystis sp.]